MENDKKDNKKNKKIIPIDNIISMLTLIICIAYLTYELINTDNILTNIKNLSVPLFLFLISTFLFIFSLKDKKNNIFLIIIPVLITIFVTFNVLNEINVIKLPQDEKVISYVNTSYSSLNEWAEKNNITLNIEYENSDTIEEGYIIRTDIKEGTPVKEIKEITATISTGPDYDKIVIVPSMIGQNVDDVVKFIEDNYMIGAIINFEVSDDTKDTIIKQSKNGDIRRDQEFILTASLGKEDELETNIEMVDLTNMNVFNAILWLKRNNITYTLNYEFSTSIKRNSVINQSVSKGEIINTKENEVLLTISKGKAIKVPNLLTMSVDDITKWIINNKLKVEFNEVYDEKVEVGKVISASVNEKDEVEVNSLVTITISKGQIKMQNFDSLYSFREWANKYNINYNEYYEYSNSISKGGIINFSCSENDIIDPDEVINVTVSLGKAVVIPSFIGVTKGEATTTCNNLGIRCTFTTGTYTKYNESVIYSQSKTSGTKVASGSTITLTLSKGVPSTKKLFISESWLSYGNADATINSLTEQFVSKFPGVNFNFIKVKDNTIASGLLAANSPTTAGTSVTQGETYTIYIVSN